MIPFLQNYEIIVSLIFFWQVVLSIFISTSDAFFRSHYGYPYTRPYKTFSSNYGKPKPRPSLFKPIEDLNIPEQGPSLIIPEETRRQVPFSSNYGVPGQRPPVLKPIEDLNIPEQGPSLIIPEETRRQLLPTFNSNYGVSDGPKPPVFKPIEDLNIPEQGPQLLIPEETRRQDLVLQPQPPAIVSDFAIPSIEMEPNFFVQKPLEDPNIHEEGPKLLIPDESIRQSVPTSPQSSVYSYR